MEINDKRRQQLRKEFVDKAGVPHVIELTHDYVTKIKKTYSAKYVHMLEEELITYREQTKSLIKMTNKIEKELGKKKDKKEKTDEQKNK